MRLQLKPNYLRLFRAIVADVWKSEQANAQGIEKAAEKRIEILKAQCDKLDRCFIFDGAIDRTACERQRDRLRAETTVAELELGDARFDELEVEGVLAFAEHVLGNLVALWTNADAGDRRRVQEALFPTGLVWDGERFGTAVTIPIFNWLPEILGVRNQVASPTGHDRLYFGGQIAPVTIDSACDLNNVRAYRPVCLATARVC
jgi:hypothetical protein